MYAAHTRAMARVLPEWAQVSEMPDTCPTRENDPMDHQGATTAVLTVDHYPPELARPCHTAVRVLHDHAEVSGLCVVCGLSWPCEPAQLGEHNLALL